MLGVPGSIPGRVMAQLVRVLTGWARRVGAMLGVPGSIPGPVLAQLVRALTGWARWLVPCLGSPDQSQAGSWLSWLER